MGLLPLLHSRYTRYIYKLQGRQKTVSCRLPFRSGPAAADKKENKQPKPKKKVATTISCKRKMYRFSDFIVHNFHANFIVHCYLPRQFDHLLNGNWFSEEIFWRMITYISKNNVLQAIRRLKSEKWWDDFRKIHHMRWCKDVMLKFMFDERDEEVVEYVEVGSPEYKRFIAENNKQAKIKKKK